jgi:hypothetical protein
MTAADRAKGLDPDEARLVDGAPGRSLADIVAPGCPPPALLRAASVGALPDEIAGGIGAHVHACAICRQLTADLLDLDTEIDMLEDARIRRRVDRGRRAPVWRIAAIAATVTIAAGGALLVLAASKIGAIPVVDRPARATPRPPFVSILSADKLAPRITAATLVWRGGGDRFELDLAAALKPYADNNFKAAGAALERLASRYPDRAEPVLYLGVSRLLMDRPLEAEKALRKAASLGGPMVDDARWYLSVALYQNGHRPEARQLLADLCVKNGARSAEACVAQDQAGDTR